MVDYLLETLVDKDELIVDEILLLIA